VLAASRLRGSASHSRFARLSLTVRALGLVAGIRPSGGALLDAAENDLDVPPLPGRQRRTAEMA